jgi:hypothetical protein
MSALNNVKRLCFWSHRCGSARGVRGLGVNRHQTEVVAYLQEENGVLREQLGRQRLRLTDAQRRRLAAKGSSRSLAT